MTFFYRKPGYKWIIIIVVVLGSGIGCKSKVGNNRIEGDDRLLFKLDKVTLDFVVDKLDDGCRLPRLFMSFSVTNQSNNEVELFESGNFNFCSYHSVPVDSKVVFENKLLTLDTFKYKGILTNLVCLNNPIILKPKQTESVEFIVAVRIFSSSIQSTLKELDNYLQNLKAIKNIQIQDKKTKVIDNDNYELVLKLDDQIVKLTDSIALRKHADNDLERVKEK